MNVLAVFGVGMQNGVWIIVMWLLIVWYSWLSLNQYNVEIWAYAL